MKKSQVYFLPDRLLCYGKSHQIEQTLNQLAKNYSTVHELLCAFQRGLEGQPDPQ